MFRRMVQLGSVLVVLLISACNNETEQQTENGEMGDQIKDRISGTATMLGEKTDEIKDSLSAGLATSNDAMKDLSETTSDSLSSAKDSVADGVSATKDRFGDLGDSMASGINKLGSATSNGAAAKDSIAGSVDKAKQSASEFTQSAKSKLTEFENAAADKVIGTGDSFADATQSVNDKASRTGDVLSDSTQALAEKANAGVDSLSSSAKELTANAKTAGEEVLDFSPGLNKAGSHEPGLSSSEGVGLTPSSKQLEHITFVHDSSELDSRSETNLDRIAVQLKNQSSLKLAITGYTDSLGPEDYNILLSKKRALLVQNHLVSKGVNPKNLMVQGLGEKNPISANDTRAGRRANRRVELSIIE